MIPKYSSFYGEAFANIMYYTLGCLYIFFRESMEASPTIVHNFRGYALRKFGICSYKYELSFKVGLSKVWGLMQARNQNAYFFTLVDMLSQKIDKHNTLENVDWNFEILLDLLEHSSGEKTIFPHLPNPRLSLVDTAIQKPEFSISHTFNKEQVARLFESFPQKKDNVIRIGNKTTMLSLVRSDGKYTIYDPHNASKEVTVNSSLDASKKVFKLLRRYYDGLTDKVALCVAVYKVIRKNT